RSLLSKPMLETLAWTGEALRLLDQTRLPTETIYVEVHDERETWDAIKRLVVRGAPAIGVAAAFGVYLGVRQASDEHAAFDARLEEVCAYLVTARPTAVNLRWAVERVQRVAQAQSNSVGAKQRILQECLAMLEEDRQICR